MIPAGIAPDRRAFYARRRLTPALLLAGLASLLLTLVLSPAPARAALPEPVDAATARAYLAALPVATEDRTGYDRDLFPHWSSQGDGCDTRDTVLVRDGSDVSVGDDCAVDGSWYSVYDGATWYDPQDVDIDHLVPLAEAWDSGAGAWTTDEREAFANDLAQPQLIAVTDNVNQSKGDQDPAEWLPPLSDYHCVYARAWVQVKYHYGLAVDSAEQSALSGVLAGC
ncbi:HNH endonuclease family protein [Streptomyces sp. 4N509B]|uniref:HNH endonuclease family protein n=1 Tax=Streptomyces sp. 4N509B TaxID=3457413 RepID=UPI003FD38E07